MTAKILTRPFSAFIQPQENGYTLISGGRFLMHFCKSAERDVCRAELSSKYISFQNQNACEYNAESEDSGWFCVTGSGNICYNTKVAFYQRCRLKDLTRHLSAMMAHIQP